MATSRAVSSRVFGYETEEREKLIMLPFGDLFNHKNPPHLIWGYGTNAQGMYGWKFEAIESVRAGE